MAAAIGVATLGPTGLAAYGGAFAAAAGLVAVAVVAGLGAGRIGALRGIAERVRARPGATLAVVLIGAGLARFGLTLADPPMLSDDLARYVDDGKTLAGGENPYARSPAAKYGSGAPPPAGAINHPELVTIYQPVSQGAFAGLWLIHEAVRGAGVNAPPRLTYRLGMSAVGVGIVAVIGWGLIAAGRSPAWAAAYGWHPLAITETATSGHQDVLGIALLLGAVASVGIGRIGERWGQSVGWGRSLGAAALLAAAVAVKPIVAPAAIPLMGWLWRRGAGGRQLAGGVGVGAGALVVIYLPLALMPGGLTGMWQTVDAFVGTWAFNGSIHPLLMGWIGSRSAVDSVAAVASLIAMAWAMRQSIGPAAPVGALLLTMTLTSSTAHPWYVLWVLALLPWVLSEAAQRRDASAWVVGAGGLTFSMVVPLAYTAFVNPMEFQPLRWAVAVEYASVYGAVIGAWIWAAIAGRAVAGSGSEQPLERSPGLAMEGERTVKSPGG